MYTSKISNMLLKLLRITLLLFMNELCWARIHKLEIQNDGRKYIALSAFGFYKGGTLDVQLQNFRATPQNDTAMFGFSLDRTLNDAMNPYLDSHQDRCLLQEPLRREHDASVIYFIMDLKNKVMHVKCSPDRKQVHIYRNITEIPIASPKRTYVRSGNLLVQRRKRREIAPAPSSVAESDVNPCDQLHLPITSEAKGDPKVHYYNTSFVMYVAGDEEEGLYNLYFHSCPNYESGQEVDLDFRMQITEENVGNFLSAGEMPLPALYCTMSVLFVLSGSFWVFLLRQARHPVFKIHYLMAVLVFLKALSLAFHGMNYHFIEQLGVHLATWAVLYYVAHLLKGALLFVTLVLVGTGWTFIKHVLAPRDKRLFMAVIPLQVLANVAEIILAESEEGAREHRAWRDVFILVDLLCCGCILFPVVWSIRHLQQASATGGKVAINLRKLKLFRHFYVMIVCYIYFTRIIVYLLRITVPFQYGWLDEMFREMATYVFFVLTGYKFRPASHNPYFSVPLDEDDDEEDLVYLYMNPDDVGCQATLTESGAIDGLTRVGSRKVPQPPTPTLTEVSEQESDILLSQKESSHEYD